MRMLPWWGAGIEVIFRVEGVAVLYRRGVYRERFSTVGARRERSEMDIFCSQGMGFVVRRE